MSSGVPSLYNSSSQHTNRSLRSQENKKTEAPIPVSQLLQRCQATQYLTYQHLGMMQETLNNVIIVTVWTSVCNNIHPLLFPPWLYSFFHLPMPLHSEAIQQMPSDFPSFRHLHICFHSVITCTCCPLPHQLLHSCTRLRHSFLASLSKLFHCIFGLISVRGF